MTKKINIAIDGPAGSGKGTTAKMIAQKLQYTYLDSGAIYRAITLFFLDSGFGKDDKDKILPLLNTENIKIYFDKKSGNIFLNGKDVEDEIRSERINKNVSVLFKDIPEVRSFVTLVSGDILKQKGVVLDGRDAGAVLAPDSELKIYLDASPWERARRRVLQYGKSDKQSIKDMEENIIKKRDLADKKDLDIAKKNGILVDTTNTTINEQVSLIEKMANNILKNHGQ